MPLPRADEVTTCRIVCCTRACRSARSPSTSMASYAAGDLEPLSAFASVGVVFREEARVMWAGDASAAAADSGIVLSRARAVEEELELRDERGALVPADWISVLDV